MGPKTRIFLEKCRSIFVSMHGVGYRLVRVGGDIMLGGPLPCQIDDNAHLSIDDIYNAFLKKYPPSCSQMQSDV